MKRILVGLMVLAGLSMTLAGGANAAHPGFGLGIHGGYGESDNAESGSPVAGAHLVLNVAPWLGFAGMVDYKFEEDLSPDEGALTITSYPVSLLARIYLPVSGISPYVTGGVQYRFVSYGGDAFDNVEFDDSDAAFGWVLGGGLEFNLGESMGLFGEGQFQSADPDKDFENAVEDVENLSYDQWTAVAGLTFYLK